MTSKTLSPYDLGKYYKHPQITWTAEECKKISNRIATDGLGTPYHFKGYIGNIVRIGQQRYNGGTVRNGKHYVGDDYGIPKVAKGFSIRYMISWGYVLVANSNKDMIARTEKLA